MTVGIFESPPTRSWCGYLQTYARNGGVNSISILGKEARLNSYYLVTAWTLGAFPGSRSLGYRHRERAECVRKESSGGTQEQLGESQLNSRVGDTAERRANIEREDQLGGTPFVL
jgi:hypothetical protein